jgi:hypothetical protein
LNENLRRLQCHDGLNEPVRRERRKIWNVVAPLDQTRHGLASDPGQGHPKVTVTEGVDQISAVTTAADDRQRIGQRRAKAQPLPAHRSEIGEYLACAALEEGDSRRTDRLGEAAKLDCARDATGRPSA